MIEFIDLAVSMGVMALAIHWGDGNSTHGLVVALAIGLSSFVSYVRGTLTR